MAPREPTLTRLLRERGRHLADPELFARARVEAHAAETAMAGQDNPEGLADFDPMDDPEFAASVQAYSDRLRDSLGRPRIDLLRHREVVDLVRSAPDVPPEPGDELPD